MSSGKLLLAGFAALGIGAFLLLRFVMTDEVSAGPRAPVVEAAKEEAPAESPKVEAPVVAPSGGAQAVRVEAPKAPDVPAIAPQVAAKGDDEVEYAEDGKPIPVANKQVVRNVNIQTNQLIVECIEQSGLKGLNGTAVLTYTVARKRDQAGNFVVETEDSGYEEEGTTITDAKLLECMHKTAFAMKFPPSKSPVAIWAKRQVKIVDGVLHENYLTEWGRIR